MTLRKEKMEFEIKKSRRPKNFRWKYLYNWNITAISDLVSRKTKL